MRDRFVWYFGQESLEEAMSRSLDSDAPRYDDEERRQWVLNDEGLYDLFVSECHSRGVDYDDDQVMDDFIEANARMIDEVIYQVTEGGRSPHYMKYGT